MWSASKPPSVSQPTQILRHVDLFSLLHHGLPCMTGGESDPRLEACRQQAEIAREVLSLSRTPKRATCRSAVRANSSICSEMNRSKACRSRSMQRALVFEFLTGPQGRPIPVVNLLSFGTLVSKGGAVKAAREPQGKVREKSAGGAAAGVGRNRRGFSETTAFQSYRTLCFAGPSSLAAG